MGFWYKKLKGEEREEVFFFLHFVEGKTAQFWRRDSGGAFE